MQERAAEQSAVTTKEVQETLKIKLLENTKEYLLHVVRVLHLIHQKGLDMQCRRLAKAVNKLAGTLKNLLKAAGSKTTILSDDDVEARKLEIEQAQQMLQEAQKAHDKAISKMYKLLRNPLSGDAQTQWDRVCREMHGHDLWAGVNNQMTKGRRLRTWAAFQDCFELHKLTIFTADAAKRQQFYIQQAVCKPQRATVRQHILQMGVLNDYIVRHLPMLKDSPKAVTMTKKGNAPFGKADLAAIVLASVLMMWQNQYNLTHNTFPESTPAFLPDLEAIEQVTVEKQQEKLKAKGKAATALPEAKSNPKQKASGGPTGRVPKKGCREKFCQCCTAHSGPYQTHNTLDCRCYDSNGNHLEAAAGKPAESKKPFNKFGGDKGMAFMQTMFEAYVKANKKAGKSKKHKKHDYDSRDSYNSE